jgi:hypothetical protein
MIANESSFLPFAEAADISADTLGKLPDDSAVDVLTLALESNKLIQALLEKNKGIMSRLHSMIFPKADQNKTLGQLTDVFAVNTKGTIEVLKRTSHTYGRARASTSSSICGDGSGSGVLLGGGVVVLLLPLLGGSGARWQR